MLPSIKNKYVQFNLTPTIIYEPNYLAQDLQQYRMNNFMQKKADADRFSKLLSPILSSEHRAQIWKKLYDT
ncbi:MAG: hypothetical protein WCJ72_13785 [Chryseobacterium sp.]